MFVTVGNGVLSASSSGTDVVLARFPDEGQDLTAFGLDPAIIKSIAIPNDLQEWPTSALNGCTALERISSYGNEIDESLYTLVRSHFLDCSKLEHIHIPSSADIGESEEWGIPVFPMNIKSVVFPSTLKEVRCNSFFYCKLLSVDFSRCQRLTRIDHHSFSDCISLKMLDLSQCSCLQSIWSLAFGRDKNLSCVIFPPSLTYLDQNAFADATSTYVHIDALNTIIWKECSSRPSGLTIHRQAFGFQKTFDTLVEEKIIQEIFVP